MKSKSEIAYKEAELSIPGGVNSPVRAFQSLDHKPIFLKKGKGCIITDIDDNEYIDYCLSWGVHILGHANEQISTAAKQAIDSSSSFGAPTLSETKLAQLVTQSVDSVESVRFVNSGTEAVMSALRLARAYTKRDKILKFDGCYHGHSDYLLVSAGSGLATQNIASSPGVPSDFAKHTISVPLNDVESLKNAFALHGESIAAVILEPVPANMGVILPQKEFLKSIQELCNTNNSLLVFDEVITGFRFSVGGAQKLLDITPDLTTFGKIIGGGFPVGAFGGKKEIMRLLAPEGGVYQAGTLSGNPVAMASGIAALTSLRNDNVYADIIQNSKDFFRSLDSITKRYNITLNRFETMFTLFFTDQPVTNFKEACEANHDQFRKFYLLMLQKGIYFSPSSYETNFLSICHTKKTLNNTLEIIEKVLKKVV